eukprot:TRINITY_DN1986_c0_g2_i1.p1 TRINITY_DN1986_c0_g2~~TRINITY_DN1986_c0_g2_i1.p1  ORF type:complete len:89 (-),score=11.92 TRINITY_DN1986_c0_g2_i1:215-481(-)
MIRRVLRNVLHDKIKCLNKEKCIEALEKLFEEELVGTITSVEFTKKGHIKSLEEYLQKPDETYLVHLILTTTKAKSDDWRRGVDREEL